MHPGTYVNICQGFTTASANGHRKILMRCACRGMLV